MEAATIVPAVVTLPVALIRIGENVVSPNGNNLLLNPPVAIDSERFPKTYDEAEPAPIAVTEVKNRVFAPVRIFPAVNVRLDETVSGLFNTKPIELLLFIVSFGIEFPVVPTFEV